MYRNLEHRVDAIDGHEVILQKLQNQSEGGMFFEKGGRRGVVVAPGDQR